MASQNATCPSLQQLIEGLNPNQRKAVEAVLGKVLVLAGAGSGKTRVLTLRIAHLIEHHGVPPQAILGLTFTNKAAEEMRHRLAALIPKQAAKQVTLCTFHSFCLQVLRKEIHRLGFTSRFTLYGEQDMRRLVTQITRDIIDTERELPSLAPTMDLLSLARNRGLTSAQIEAEGGDWYKDYVKELYERLGSSLRAYNALDFDHLLWLTVDLFDRFPDVLERYQERYQYLLIDEYQDTNPIQDRIAMQISARSQNLCVVGDDDQSIYGWRGADVKNILDFDAQTVVKLEQNYRSTNLILKAANAVIGNNTKRHNKSLWSSRADDEPIEVFFAPTETDEADAVAARIVKMREIYGFRWSDFAILYRSNILSRPIEQSLLRQTWSDFGHWRRGVPYHIHGGTEFYERREVKDVMGYLRVLVNPQDEEALLRIINQPRRGISDLAVDHLTSFNRQGKIPLYQVIASVVSEDPEYEELRGCLSQRALGGLCAFHALLSRTKERLSNQELAPTLQSLLEEIQYKKAIEDEVKSSQMREFKWGNVQALVEDLQRFETDTEERGLDALHAFITSTPLNQDKQDFRKEDALSDVVNIMTIHSAKGLEFPVCFLIGMEDQIMPHEKSVKEGHLEEERRLMYVAMTRAKRFLVLSMAQKRKKMGQEIGCTPSRFVKEIPKDLLNVTHWHAI